MGLFHMDSGERELHEKFIAESSHLFGWESDYYQAEYVRDLYDDPELRLKTPVKVNILFVDQPKPKLRELGWLTESNANPYLAYMTNYTHEYERLQVSLFSKIVLPSDIRLDDESEDERSFQITNIQGSQVDPLFWIIKLVPWRYKVDFKSAIKDGTLEYSDTSDRGNTKSGSTTSTGVNYLDIDSRDWT